MNQLVRYCDKCNSPLIPGIPYCQRCGAPVLDAPPTPEAEGTYYPPPEQATSKTNWGLIALLGGGGLLVLLCLTAAVILFFLNRDKLLPARVTPSATARPTRTSTPPPPPTTLPPTDTFTATLPPSPTFTLSPTFTQQAVCTPPPCKPGEIFTCPSGNCPGGCGTTCATPTGLPPKPSDTPDPNAPYAACPGARLSRLKVGMTAKVSPGLPNRVRSAAGTSNAVIGQFPEDEVITILDGPGCADGWVWWKARSVKTGLTGWTAEGDQNEYWLVPVK